MSLNSFHEMPIQPLVFGPKLIREIANGLCALEIDLHSDDAFEIATGYDIAISGLNVLRTCVQGTPNRGGMTSDIGR